MRAISTICINLYVGQFYLKDSLVITSVTIGGILVVWLYLAFFVLFVLSLCCTNAGYGNRIACILPFSAVSFR